MSPPLSMSVCVTSDAVSPAHRTMTLADCMVSLPTSTNPSSEVRLYGNLCRPGTVQAYTASVCLSALSLCRSPSLSPSLSLSLSLSLRGLSRSSWHKPAVTPCLLRNRGKERLPSDYVNGMQTRGVRGGPGRWGSGSVRTPL